MIIYGIAAMLVLPLALIACARRQIAALVYAVFVLIAFGGFVETLGKPRPIEVEWRDMAGMEIISFRLVEPEAIYLWVDGMPPIAYRLPWSKEEAQQLHEASMEAGDMPIGIGTTPDGTELVFHPQPILPLPDKHR